MASNSSPMAQSQGKLFLQKTSKEGGTPEHVDWQMEHRLELVSYWDIKPGSRVLEIGCGQGDCTIVLADQVGEKGHVDAVDPGAPDYGSPYTLSQSQSHILSGPLGSRITFHTAFPVDFLSSLPPSHQPYDYVVLSHCIWYFSSPSLLTPLITALVPHTKYICIAEWSLRASKFSSQPHVLTALLLSSLEAKRAIEGSGNIRSVLSPKQITSSILAPGNWKLVKEETRMTNEGLQDAYWEVSHTLRKREKVLRRLEEEGVNEKELGVLEAGYDAVEAAVGLLPGGDVKEVRSMDVWMGIFEVV